jgi:hypothetical protein
MFEKLMKGIIIFGLVVSIGCTIGYFITNNAVLVAIGVPMLLPAFLGLVGLTFFSDKKDKNTVETK